ncbi:MAG: phosphopantetheine-binding protein [Geminicoccaceae bacterium]
MSDKTEGIAIRREKLAMVGKDDVACMISDILDIPVADLKVENSFHSDLGADDLAMLEIFGQADSQFDIQMPDHVCQSVATVNDLIDAINGTRAGVWNSDLLQRLQIAIDANLGPVLLSRKIADHHVSESLQLAILNIETADDLEEYMQTFSGMDPQATNKAAIIGIAGAVINIMRRQET